MPAFNVRQNLSGIGRFLLEIDWNWPLDRSNSISRFQFTLNPIFVCSGWSSSCRMRLCLAGCASPRHCCRHCRRRHPHHHDHHHHHHHHDHHRRRRHHHRRHSPYYFYPHHHRHHYGHHQHHHCIITTATIIIIVSNHHANRNPGIRLWPFYYLRLQKFLFL